MKKLDKGFTLIELLGILILLAIIALITYPIIDKVIKNAKEEAYNRSIDNLLDAASKYGTMNDLGYSSEQKQLSFEDLKKSGLIKDTDIKDPRNSEIISGCILYNWNDSTNQYKYVYSADCVADGGSDGSEYVDASGANGPELLNKMVPVIYNTSTGKWQYADTTQQWYDYDSKWWANAVVLINSPSKTYSVGNDIEMTDIAMMYVWIPRYTYTIFNGNNGSVDEQQIIINFETGTNSSGTVACINDTAGNQTCSDSTNGSIIDGTSTYTHPAFTFGTTQLTGFWIGKFETSTTETDCLNEPSEANCNNINHTLEIKPNVDSLRYISVSNLFNSMLNTKTKYNMSNVDTHMIKNMEWGAVSYLTNSKYGRCTNGICEEVTMNNVIDDSNYYRTYTGCAGDEISITSVVTCSANNRYETETGLTASTTKNIYGVYDLSGGVDEYVMGNMMTYSTQEFNVSLSGFASEPNLNYFDYYPYSPYYYTYERGKLGDATKETRTWNGDNSSFYSGGSSFLERGGDAHSGNVLNSAGIFNFYHSDGYYYYYAGSRLVVISQYQE